MIFHSNPWAANCNIGKGYNDFISQLPDDAWICLTDGDICYLTPLWGKHIEDLVTKYGDEYALIGATTNRLGGVHQLHENKFSSNFDMFHHYEIAKKLEEERYCEVEETSKVIAGFFMLFSKKTWQAAGKFKEGTVSADAQFNEQIRNNKIGKIGIAKGLYVFHCYRIWNQNHISAWHDTKHLIK